MFTDISSIYTDGKSPHAPAEVAPPTAAAAAASGGAAAAAEPVDPGLMAVARYLQKAIPHRDGILEGRRFRIFTVNEAMNSLMGPRAPLLPVANAETLRKEMQEAVAQYEAAARANPKNPPPQPAGIRLFAVAVRQTLARMRNADLIDSCIATIDLVRQKSQIPGEPDRVRERISLKIYDGDHMSDDGVYVFLVQESSFMSVIYMFIVICLIVAIPLFAVWPYWLRMAALYTVGGLAGVLLVALLVARPALYYGTRYIYPADGRHALTLFPNADRDDIPLLESFKPFIGWDDYVQREADELAAQQAQKEKKDD